MSQVNDKRELLNIFEYLHSIFLKIEKQAIIKFLFIKGALDAIFFLLLLPLTKSKSGFVYDYREWFHVLFCLASIGLIVWFAVFVYQSSARRREAVEVFNTILRSFTNLEPLSAAQPPSGNLIDFLREKLKVLSSKGKIGEMIQDWGARGAGYTQISTFLDTKIKDYQVLIQNGGSNSAQGFVQDFFTPPSANDRTILILLFIVLASFNIWHCVKMHRLLPHVHKEARPSQPSSVSPGCPDDDEIYAAALKNACFPEEKKVSNELLAITKDNIAFEKKGDRNCIRVFAVKDKDYYSPYINQDYSTGDRYTFVFTKKEFFNKYQLFSGGNGKALTVADSLRRVNQLLGLPPGNTYNYVVEFSVDTANLFRPCPDKEITDCKCDLLFPASATNDHKAFLRKWRSDSYNNIGDLGKNYPFTQLGYTYDWSVYSPDHVGISEFIIDKNSKVEIKTVTRDLITFLRKR